MDNNIVKSFTAIIKHFPLKNYQLEKQKILKTLN